MLPSASPSAARRAAQWAASMDVAMAAYSVEHLEGWTVACSADRSAAEMVRHWAAPRDVRSAVWKETSSAACWAAPSAD